LQIIWLVFIGIQYVKAEQLSKIAGEHSFETSQLDDLFFVKANLDVEAILDSLGYIHMTSKQQKQILIYKDYSKEALEASFGKLTSDEITWLNDFFRAINYGPLMVRKWIEQNPEKYAEIINYRS